jgi:hypothetical protein
MHAEQPAFIEERVLLLYNLPLDVHERLGQETPARVDDAHQPVLLDHGLAAAASGIVTIASDE